MKTTSCNFTDIFSSFDAIFEETNHLFEQAFGEPLAELPKESPNGELTYNLTLNGRSINIVSTPDSLSIEVDGEEWAKKDAKKV